MDRKQLLHWIWLSLALGSANRSAAALMETFGDALAVYRADEGQLSHINDLSAPTRRALLNKSLEEATRIFDLCEQKGIGILTYTQEEFPDVLRTIELPPVLLYYRGVLPDLNRRFCVAMVGTRSMSEYGMHSAYRISYELASANAVVVSGMARGIDGVCSAAALAAGGETVAILGCGVDVLYPKRHRVLCEEICARGAVMSEYPPDSLPLKWHFPERNRLISGMCRATLVIEGGKESGSLITAREALSENRAVYALPADVGRAVSEGTNLLLEEGAKPLLCARDVLLRYVHTYKHLAVDDLARLPCEQTQTDVEYLTRLGVLKPSRKRARTETNTTKRQEREALAASQNQTQEAEKVSTPLSETLLSSLPPVQAAILRRVAQEEHGVCADVVYALPYPYGEISAAMTQLEIKRLIKRLPGSLIGRS